MLKNFEDIQKLGKDNVDVAMKQFGTVSKGWQAIASEFADYSKKSFEDGSAALEKLFGAKSLEKAIEVQSDYVKTSYEGFVAEAATSVNCTPTSPRRATSRSRVSSPRSAPRGKFRGAKRDTHGSATLAGPFSLPRGHSMSQRIGPMEQQNTLCC